MSWGTGVHPMVGKQRVSRWGLTGWVYTFHGDHSSAVVFSEALILQSHHSVPATVSELCILSEQPCSLALMVHAVLGASRQQLPILPVQGHILGRQLTLKAGTAPLFHTHILEGATNFIGMPTDRQTNSCFCSQPPTTLSCS